MPDPLSAVATTEPTHGPLLGLRRRHQAGFVFQHNSEEDDGGNDLTRGGAEVDTENRDGNAPRNNGTEFPSRQASTNPANNDASNSYEDANVNNHRTTSAGQPSPPTTLFSPLSGSIGIGIFRISRLYCFLSIILALIAIVLAPIPTHKLQYHDLATMIYEVTEEKGLVLENSPIKATTIKTENDDDRRDVKKNINIVDNVNSIVTDLKSWSVEEFITHAAFLGVAASRNRKVDSSIVGVSSDDGGKRRKKEAGNKDRKRRRRPAVLKEQHLIDSSENIYDLVTEVDLSEAKKSLFASTLSKTRASPGNKNRNDDDSQVPTARLRNWIERMGIIMDETLAEILQQRKSKLQMAVEQKVRWRGSRKNEDTTDDAIGREGNSDDSDYDREGNDDIDTMERARNKLNEDWQFIDPTFLEDGSFSYIFTNVIDKILKSTIRLCIITNFLLTMTYLLHSAMAAWFLSHSGASNNAAAMQRQHETSIREDRARMVSEYSFASPSGATVARERMGGFLIFKLLLISAVLAPDTLDLMILVTWFALLGCLRSLDHLAHSTNIHLAAMGQPPKKGIVQLLFWVLTCDIVAAGSCVALFHTAGYGMVLLLTCDCALLGTDAVSHILKYYQSILENSHDNDIRNLEDLQLNLHRDNEDDSVRDNIQIEEEREEAHSFSFFSGAQEQSLPATAAMTLTELRQESGRLDHRMEELELAHNRRLSILDTAVFCLDMTCHILTIAHFCHIWTLHGVQFTLIDGVLALHLHSAISSACAKLARRRNVHKISQDLEGRFLDATEEELKQASIDGDVCCICLGSMTNGGNVKKVHCGHIYHTHCLREVIERAQNLQSAKCPLCRASLVDHCHSTTDPSIQNDMFDNSNFIRQSNTPVSPRVEAAQRANQTIDSQIEGDDDGDTAPIRQVEGERALFRISTEGILPVWMPVPAFSFEVVRRPPLGAQRAAQSHNQLTQAAAPAPTSTHIIDPVATLPSNPGEANPQLRTEFEIQAQQSQEQDAQLPFFQRILLFTGLLPMSPEAEARALTQLVDMFPQYDRGELSRELRNRGSLEAVTEAILIGIFPGVPRG